MQNAHWLAFGSSNSLQRTILHFMPAAAGTAAPYGVSVGLRLHSPGAPARELNLEGARLMQPDGVRLEDAFPVVMTEGGPALYGIEVALNSTQTRADLSPSFCAVEFTGNEGGCVYRAATPKRSAANDDAQNQRAGIPVCQDGFLIPSLVVVNASSEDFEARFSIASTVSGAEARHDVRLPRVAAGVTSEHQLGELVRMHGATQECSWGIARHMVLFPETDCPERVALYLISRDAATKRVAAVVAI